LGGISLEHIVKLKQTSKENNIFMQTLIIKVFQFFIENRVSNCNLNIEKGRYLKLLVEQDLSIVPYGCGG
jgi:hypothetical protein